MCTAFAARPCQTTRGLCSDEISLGTECIAPQTVFKTPEPLLLGALQFNRRRRVSAVKRRKIAWQRRTFGFFLWGTEVIFYRGYHVLSANLEFLASAVGLAEQ